MVNISLSIDASTVSALIGMMQNAVDSIGSQAVAPSYIPADDPDLRKTWEDGLRKSLQSDCNFLLQVFRDNRFGCGEIEIEDTTAEGLMRACSAIRFKLRDTMLTDLTDAQLENGEVDILELPSKKQSFYACYLFLGGLQSMIISKLDPLCDEF